MRKLLTVLCLCCAVAGCKHTLEDYAGDQYKWVAGHPYLTDPKCKRTKPLGKFDKKCDWPKRGFPGFWFPGDGGSPGGMGVGAVL